MMEAVKFGSILLCILGSSINQSIPGGSDSQFFMTEIVRVKRQAGYVYNRPSVTFDLPPRSPPSPPPTQAPTVDRAQTQAQQMYYAYPAPAAQPGANLLNAGATTAQQTSGGTSGGYNYAPQIGGGQASASAGQQPSTGGASSGYNYAPQNIGGQTSSGTAGVSAELGGGSQGSQGSVAAGYSYSSPTTGTGSAAGSQASISGVTQSSSSASSQTNTGSQAGTSSGSGYSYQVPNPTLQPNLQTEVSTNAPKYLPPTGSAGGSVNAGASDGGGIQAPPPPPPPPPAATGSSGGYGAGGADQPAIPAPPTDQYLPPLPQTQTENTLQNPNANLAVNTGTQTGSFSAGPSASYIPPAGPRPVPAADVTPRPFAPPPPAGYLPPNVNAETSSGQGSLSTPASTYLPPVL